LEYSIPSGNTRYWSFCLASKSMEAHILLKFCAIASPFSTTISRFELFTELFPSSSFILLNSSEYLAEYFS
jgi:hypothetical protein